MQKITDDMIDQMDENNAAAKDLLAAILHMVDQDENANSVMIGDVCVLGLVKAAHDYILRNDRVYSEK